MPLWEIVELLKRELNLKGNSADVVAESCAQLNVADEGSLVDRAERCRGVLCGARGGARVVPAVEADVVAAGVVAAPAHGAGVATPTAAMMRTKLRTLMSDSSDMWRWCTGVPNNAAPGVS